MFSSHRSWMLLWPTVPMRRLVGARKQTALRALTRPCSICRVPPIGSVVLAMRSTTVCGLAYRQLACTSAAMPATSGDDMDVPEHFAYSAAPALHVLAFMSAVDRTLVPGAATSTQLP